MIKIILMMALVFVVEQGVSQSNFNISTKSNFKLALKKRVLPLKLWLAKMNSENFDLMCFGETHNTYYRDLLASKFLNQLRVNGLAIEELQDEADKFMELVHTPDGPSLNVTGVPFNKVAESYFNTSGTNAIFGVEASQEQKAQITFSKLDQLNGKESSFGPSRDSAIATNINKILQSKDRLFVVYGAKHCSYFEDGLGFDTPFLRQLYNLHGVEKKMVAVHTLDTEEQSLIKTYLKSFGLAQEGGDWVLFNTREIDPKVYNYRMGLFKLLQSYDVLYLPQG